MQFHLSERILFPFGQMSCIKTYSCLKFCVVPFFLIPFIISDCTLSFKSFLTKIINTLKSNNNNHKHTKTSLQWRQNERIGVSNYHHIYCLLSRLFGRTSKKTWKLRVTGLCDGNPPVTDGFPSQRASNAEMFPFDDVVMMTPITSIMGWHGDIPSGMWSRWQMHTTACP